LTEKEEKAVAAQESECAEYKGLIEAVGKEPCERETESVWGRVEAVRDSEGMP
jgi:hypothetical protein